MIDFTIDTSDLESLYQVRIPKNIAAVFRGLEYPIKTALIGKIKEVFISATVGLEEIDWPLEYTAHLLKTIDENADDIVTIISGDDFFDITIDFDGLGTMEDLEAAYHYRARLADGGEVSLPYQGEALKQEDETKRFYSFIKLGYELNWNATKQARLNLWASYQIAPQWLLLLYGTSWGLAPAPILEVLDAEAKLFVEGLLTSHLEAAIEFADNKGNTSGVYYDPSGAGSKFRGPGGKFVADPRRSRIT